MTPQQYVVANATAMLKGQTAYFGMNGYAFILVSDIPVSIWDGSTYVPTTENRLYVWTGSIIESGQTDQEFIDQVREFVKNDWHEYERIETIEELAPFIKEQSESIAYIGTIDGKNVYKGRRTGKLFFENGKRVTKSQYEKLVLDL